MINLKPLFPHQFLVAWIRSIADAFDQLSDVNRLGNPIFLFLNNLRRTIGITTLSNQLLVKCTTDLPFTCIKMINDTTPNSSEIVLKSGPVAV